MESEAFRRAHATLAAEHERTVQDIVTLTEIEAPSSNHSDGRLAQAPLITAANTATAHGSSSLPRGRAGAGW